MNINVSNIVNEWSYRLSLIEDHDGFPDIKSYSDLTVLKSVLTEYEWPVEACYEFFKKIGNKVIIGEMSLDQKNVEKIYPKKDFPKYRGKVKPFSKAILNSANDWIEMMNVPNVGDKEIWDYKIVEAKPGSYIGNTSTGGILISISKDWESEQGTYTLYGYLKKLSSN